MDDHVAESVTCTGATALPHPHVRRVSVIGVERVQSSTTVDAERKKRNHPSIRNATLSLLPGVMTDWLERARPALLEAISSVYEQVNQDIADGKGS